MCGFPLSPLSLSLPLSLPLSLSREEVEGIHEHVFSVYR